MKITVMGGNCPLEDRLRTDIEEIIHELGLECKLDIIRQLDEILHEEEHRILIMPALLVDNTVLFQGHVWPKDQIKDFLHRKLQETSKPADNNHQFDQWKGLPRESIDWHPIIDENKCVGCGMCVT
ncbi:MAG: hypothetical protein EOM80_17865, partial [Erysipelotrichia bacterium]|nr:hypothetical protein [Erysipelotrichia bacterium]